MRTTVERNICSEVKSQRRSRCFLTRKHTDQIYLGDFLTVSVPLSLAIEDRFIVEWE